MGSSRSLKIAPVRKYLLSSWTSLTILAIAVVAQLSFLSWRLGLPLELDRNEAWNAWHIADGLDVARLYPDPQDLVVNNYPPLSFVMIKLMSGHQDIIFVGRIVSLLSIFCITAGCVNLTKLLGSNYRGALWSGALCLAEFCIVMSRYAGMNDPNFFALAVMLIGLNLFFKASLQDRIPWLGCIVMVLSLFIKHNIVALPLAAFVWLRLARRDLFIVSAITFVCLGASGLAICYWVYGADFFSQLLMPRVVRFSRGFRVLIVIPPLIPFLLVWYRWKSVSINTDATRLTTLLLSSCAVLNFLQACGAGVDINATFEFIIATAISLGCALSQTNSTEPSKATNLDKWSAPALMSGVFLILAFGRVVEPYRFILSSNYRNGVERQVQSFNTEVAKVRAEPGNISCRSMSVCYTAGKEFVYDEFAMSQRVATGAWTTSQLKSEIQNRNIRFETNADEVFWRSTDLTSLFR
jgi:hypothetical protein